MRGTQRTPWGVLAIVMIALGAGYGVSGCGRVSYAEPDEGPTTYEYSPRFLFTVEYGSADEQVGVSLPCDEPECGEPAGPTGIAVGHDGSVYIADRINGCIKRFDERGRLLMRTEGVLDNIQRLAVDSKGNVYSLGGGSIGGLAKLGPDGKMVWQGAAVPGEALRAFGPLASDVTVGPGDMLGISVSGRHEGTAVVDSDGVFTGAYPGRYYTPAGRIVSVGPVPHEALAALVTVSDMEGRHLASYVADSRSAAPSLFVGASNGFAGRVFDAIGNMYSIAVARREQRLVLTPKLRVASDYVITRHDSEGRAVAHLRLPASPFMTGRHFCVDRDGNIYHLAYRADSVDVVKYALGPNS